MKNKIIVLVLAMAASSLSMSQGIKPPVAVKNSFYKMFPGAVNVKWGKENAKEYEAEFKLNSQSISANFKQDGSWVETESTIPVSEIPAEVKSAINTKYPNAPLLIAEKTEQPKNKVVYEITIKQDGKRKSIEINSNGTFVK